MFVFYTGLFVSPCKRYASIKNWVKAYGLQSDVAVCFFFGGDRLTLYKVASSFAVAMLNIV